MSQPNGMDIDHPATEGTVPPAQSQAAPSAPATEIVTATAAPPVLAAPAAAVPETMDVDQPATSTPVVPAEISSAPPLIPTESLPIVPAPVAPAQEPDTVTELNSHQPNGHHPPAAGPSTTLLSFGADDLVETQCSSPERIVRTGYVYDPLMMLHCQDGYTPTEDHIVDAGDGHPEEPMRIKRIFSRLRENGLISRMKQLPSQEVTYDQVVLVHTDEHWGKVQALEMVDDEYIADSKQYYEQLSLYVCRETAHCARLSCGGVIQACISVCTGEVRNAFAIVRPPGHHAEPDEHMGFCFFNNVAVATREIMRLGHAKKVLILDWDVHHGNGTQRAFFDDPNVLYISVHRHDGGRFYPTSDFGALDIVGEGAGEGKSVNIPWPSAGFGDADYIYAFQKIVMPIAYEFAPDLVIISAGFDAADGDHLGQCHVTPAGYGHMTHMLCALAGGKVVVALEGGYNLNAISDSSLAVARVLLGETPADLGPMEASDVATEVMYQVARVQSKYWKSIDVQACEPAEIAKLEDDSSPVISIPDLLKIHRAHHLFIKHQLFQIPLASSDLEESFGGQVICNEGVYEAGETSTLVVFVHDFGNLRVETDGVTTTDVHLTNSYLLDTSDEVVQWVLGNKFNLIDVNILRQLPSQIPNKGPKMVSKEGNKQEAQLIRYLWDNYIELSEAENVVLIGHGTGCGAIMDLINHRDVEHKVKAVVQVAGLHSIVRIAPQNESKRNWFRGLNRIYVPKTHPLLEDEGVKKRLGGQIFTSDKAKVVDVLHQVLPQVKEFVATKLPQAQDPPVTTTNGVSSPVAGSAIAPAVLA